VAPDGKIPPPDPANCDRGCTDILFLLFFIAFWVGIVMCASMGFEKGDINELFYFIDYGGNKCGMDGRGKYTYFTHPTSQTSNICVDECPSTAADANGEVLAFTLTGAGGYSTARITTAAQALTYANGCMASGNPPTGAQCGVYASKAPNGVYFCLPEDLSALSGISGSSAATEIMDGWSQKIKSVFADLVAGWWVLAVTAAAALIISFMWIQLLKFCAGCFVWTVIVGSVLITAGCALASYFMYVHYMDQYDQYGVDNDKSIAYCFLASCALFGLGALILLCMVICLCKKIRIAIGIVKEACEAVTAMPMIVFFPLVQYAIFLCFVCFWIVVAGYMASTGKVTQETNSGVTTYGYEFEDEMTNALLYHFFALLWNMAFLRHFTILTIAGAIGSWYWTPYVDGEKQNLPSAMVYGSACRSFRYHIGTVAFGSFIIAVIEAIQVVVEYIKRKYLDENSCLKCIGSYIQCCLDCFKRIMEFISRNAYIITACKGKNFCSAAWEAFNFIMDNLTQVAAVNWISAYLMFLGKVFIVLGSVVVAYFLAITDDDISSVIVLLIVAAIIAYCVACIFLSVFETAIDTILLCFSWESSAKGSFQGGHVYATEHLNCFIEGINVEAQTNSETKVEPVNPDGTKVETKAE